MNVGIVGLGLIGGSFARAIKETNEHTVYGYDINESTLLAAQLINAVDKSLTLIHFLVAILSLFRFILRQP